MDGGSHLNMSRRSFLQGLAGMAVCGSVAGARESLLRAVHVKSIALIVPALRRSRDFYRRLLGVRVIQEDEDTCTLELQRNYVTLLRGDTPSISHFSIASIACGVREGAKYVSSR